jgi:hypothetical protein
MSISEIGTNGYQMTGYETGKTANNVSNVDFSEQLAKVTNISEKTAVALHGDDSTGGVAVLATADVANGASISVYKTQDFDSQNPVYKVKIWDKSGNVTEQMVDVSKVNLSNCDTAEFYAYTANLKESGKGSFEDTVLKAAVAKAVKNAEQRNSTSWSFSEKTDWVKIVNDIMQSEYSYGDLKGYMEWKKFLGFLDK